MIELLIAQIIGGWDSGSQIIGIGRRKRSRFDTHLVTSCKEHICFLSLVALKFFINIFSTCTGSRASVCLSLSATYDL